MNINKKLDRVKQWAGEKVGAGSKTSVSDEFRTLEAEMQLRHEGMEKMHKSMTIYVKSLSKRNEGDDKEKILPVGRLGQTMLSHGEDFEPDSEFGNCLIGIGRTNEKIARIQENYIANASHTWLESLERSLAQMKEYQSARKKLEQRRLAYDASLSKMQKAKKEDFRVEEELRSQKAKYEESSEDVFRRMQDIKEAEEDSVADLGAFLDLQLEYYDRCRDEVLRMKREWPAAKKDDQNRRNTRARSNTAHSYHDRLAKYEEEPEPELPSRPSIRSASRVPSSNRVNSYDPYPDSVQTSPPRAVGRSQIFQPASVRRELTPVGLRQSSAIADPGMLRTHLRPSNRIQTDVFGDPSDGSTTHSTSPDLSPGGRSVSPSTSYGSVPSRNPSFTTLPMVGGRKAPPPPPPSRAKKPPPPLPAKRSDVGGVRY